MKNSLSRAAWVSLAVPALIWIGSIHQPVRAAEVRLTVDAARPVHPIPATLWGIFFEDINFGADGGLYAELVKNRSFEFTHPMLGWSQIRRGPAAGLLTVRDENPLNAAQSVRTVSPDNRNNWECALAEAAFLTGLERNSDVVAMSSYAPLSAHVDAWQWTPNLIWFDNLRVFGTPSYYVQQLFSRNRGDVVLPVATAGLATAANQQPRFYATASREEKSGEIILKVVNATVNPVEANLRLNGVAKVAAKASATVLTSAQLADENSLGEPRKVAPAASTVRPTLPEFRYTFKPYSLTILRMNTRP